MNETTESGKTIGAVERAFSIIETLRESGTMTVSEVAIARDIPTSTAHVHLKTLHSLGYVVKVDGAYRLGLRFLRDGGAIRQRQHIYQIAKNEIDGLAAETGEVANLGVEENGQRVLLYQSEGSKAVYDNAPIGEYTNMHWTALGKSLLAHHSHKKVDEIVDTYGLPSKTERTISTREELVAELEGVRDRGYALEDEERREGIRSVAVPLRVDSSVVGAISVSGTKNRLNDNRIDNKLLELLYNAANIITVRYAYE